jgi:3-deoxy-7-phosphoheptulonate synthase
MAEALPPKIAAETSPNTSSGASPNSAKTTAHTLPTAPKTHVVRVPFLGGEIAFGTGAVALIAGPCAIESREVLDVAARGVKAAGACFLRGGIYKMRTSRNSFQGLGESALDFVNETKRATAMPLVSEITDPRQIDDLIGNVEMFQVGSRNMYNYELLKELGNLRKPVLLKRAFAATVDEWLKAADYIVKGGNDGVLLCERGIRTFETTTRNTLDLNSVAYLKAYSSFPVIVDPSHGTGRPELIRPMSLAAVAAGADGLIIEVHPRPIEALSDAHQALSFAQFQEIADGVRRIAAALGRGLVPAVQKWKFAHESRRRHSSDRTTNAHAVTHADGSGRATNNI